LNEKHKEFVKAYIEKGNAAEAARIAGFSEASANKIGWKLLQRDDIKQEIERGKNKTNEPIKIEDLISLTKEALEDARKSGGDTARLKAIEVLARLTNFWTDSQRNATQENFTINLVVDPKEVSKIKKENKAMKEQLKKLGVEFNPERKETKDVKPIESYEVYHSTSDHLNYEETSKNIARAGNWNDRKRR